MHRQGLQALGELLPSPYTLTPGIRSGVGALDHPSRALRHQTHPTWDSASHRDVLYLTPGREIDSSALDPRAHLDDASTPCFPQVGAWNPPRHLLPGEETMPKSLKVHVWVGHDPSVEVDKVQALKPAWRRTQKPGLEGGQGCPVGWSVGRGCLMGDRSHTCSGAHGRPAGWRPGYPGPSPR